MGHILRCETSGGAGSFAKKHWHFDFQGRTLTCSSGEFQSCDDICWPTVRYPVSIKRLFSYSTGRLESSGVPYWRKSHLAFATCQKCPIVSPSHSKGCRSSICNVHLSCDTACVMTDPLSDSVRWKFWCICWLRWNTNLKGPSNLANGNGQQLTGIYRNTNYLDQKDIVYVVAESLPVALVCSHIYIYVYIYAYLYIYIFIYTYIYIYLFMDLGCVWGVPKCWNISILYHRMYLLHGNERISRPFHDSSWLQNLPQPTALRCTHYSLRTLLARNCP